MNNGKKSAGIGGKVFPTGFQAAYKPRESEHLSKVVLAQTETPSGLKAEVDSSSLQNQKASEKKKKKQVVVEKKMLPAGFREAYEPRPSRELEVKPRASSWHLVASKMTREMLEGLPSLQSKGETLSRTSEEIKKIGSSNIFKQTLIQGKLHLRGKDYEDPLNREIINGWIAEKTSFFCNELSLFWNNVTKGVDGLEMWFKIGFPRGVEYTWKEDPSVVVASQYVESVLSWINSMLQNEQVFPKSRSEWFPENFKEHISKMFRRMVRIFAIFHANASLYKYGASESDLFQEFLCFGWTWQLHDEEELQTLKQYISTFRGRYMKEKMEFLRDELPDF